MAAYCARGPEGAEAVRRRRTEGGVAAEGPSGQRARRGPTAGGYLSRRRMRPISQKDHLYIPRAFFAIVQRLSGRPAGGCVAS